MEEVPRPHPSVTICNTLWGSSLSFSSFSAGDAPLSFDQLFPEETVMVEMCREAGLDSLELCKLLLASNSYKTLDVLLKAGVVSAIQPFSCAGQPTLAHLACSLALAPTIHAITRTLNGATNSNAVWLLKDGKGQIPEDVCFNHDLAKRLPHRPLLRRKRQTATQPLPLTPNDRVRVFQLATSPEDFYSLILLLQGHQFNVNSERDDSGDLLIHKAVQGGIPSLPLLLAILNHFKGDINARDRNGMTPLSLACKLGHVRIAEVLVCVNGADIGLRDPDSGRTALHCATMHGHPDIIRMLLSRGADASVEDREKRDAAFLARREGHFDCREILTQHARERITALAGQTMIGTLDGSKLCSSDVCQVARDGTTLLILAARHGHAHLLRQLVAIDNCPLDYRQIETPDLLDTSMKLSAGLQALPRYGDHPFKTALHYATQAGHLECVKILLNAHAHPSIPDSDGWLPLHLACDGDYLECARAILTHPVQGRLGLSGLQPALTLARERGNNDIIALLQDAMSRRQKEIVAPALFDSAKSGNTDLLFTILENGDDVNPLKEENHDWPLLLAAENGYLDMVKHLYQFGGHVTRCHPTTGLTPLHVAAREGKDDVVAYLLNFTQPPSQTSREGGEMEGGKNINCRSKAGATPMELAAVQGHVVIVQLLLEKGASCCLPDSTGRLLTSPFHGVQFLLETYRRERIQAICDALECAVPLGQFKSIWQGPWDFNLAAESGDTFLMVAAKTAPLEVVRFLLHISSRAPPDVLVAGGAPSPFQGRPVSPEESEHTSSDNHISRSPHPPHEVLSRSMYIRRPRAASVLLQSISPRGQRKRKPENRLRFPRRRSGSPMDCKPCGSDTSGASSRGEEDEQSISTSPVGPTVPSNTGICSTIIHTTNPHDGQTALHRAALAGQHETVTLLLNTDPECAVAKDRNGDTALHMACRHTQKNIYRKTVEQLLVCNKIVASVKNNEDKYPDHDCPHSKTRRMVVKKRTDEILRVPSPPTYDPRKALCQLSESGSTKNSLLSFSDFDEKLAALKLDPAGSPPPSPDNNTSS